MLALTSRKCLTAILTLLIVVSYSLIMAQPAGGTPEARGPPLNEITWTVLNDWDDALRRVVRGELDVLMWSKPMGAYRQLSDEELAKLVFVKCVSAVWFLEFNSAGSIEPNPHPKSLHIRPTAPSGPSTRNTA
ncbi:hypothetical protein B6U66_04885 [Candidatus Bathyarchaeota archaeon ex4484_135]|nr:MAG: hypothetical protein B6U66_04885 [Candidatus Bathyarchaeota archaeon ex4484_135]